MTKPPAALAVAFAAPPPPRSHLGETQRMAAVSTSKTFAQGAARARAPPWRGGKPSFAASVIKDTVESESRHKAEHSAMSMMYGLDCRCNL